MTAWATMTAASGEVMASSGGDVGSIGLLFFLSGFVFYGLMFLRYRNTNKRHMHAKETEATTDNMQVADNYRGERKRLKNKRIDGANERQVEGAQSTGMVSTLLNGAVGSSSWGRLLRR